MRRLAVALILLLALAPAVHGEEEIPAPPLLDEWVFQRFDVRDATVEVKPQQIAASLPDGPAEAAQRLVAGLRARPVRVVASLYDFDSLPPSLKAPISATSPVLDASAIADIRSCVRAGSLTLRRRATAAGPVGAILRGEDIEEQTAVLYREIESAQGAVISRPITATVRQGLRLRAKVLPTAAGGLTLRYRLLQADTPAIDTRSTLGGKLDHVSVPALLAQGSVRLVPGETAAILRVAADGSGRLVLLSLGGRMPEVESVTDLGEGYVAVLAGHLAESRVVSPPCLANRPGRAQHAEDMPAYANAWGAFAEAAEIDDASWEEGPLGYWLGMVPTEKRPHLAELVLRGASIRGARGRIDVTRPGWGRMTLPASPGSVVHFFGGDLETRRWDTHVESGCNDSVLATPVMVTAARGLAGAGWICVDGSADVTLLGREVLHTERKSYALRRIENGYRTYTRDSFDLPLIRARTLSCRCALPAGLDRLPGGVRLRVLLDRTAPADGRTLVHTDGLGFDDALPVGGGGWLLDAETDVAEARDWGAVPLHVAGQPLAVRPGVASWLELVTHDPYVRRWSSAGWCGMRARYPEVDGTWDREAQEPIAEGTSLGLRVHREHDVLLLDTDGVIRRAPEDLGEFEPGDGRVRIVRSPRLQFDIHALPLGGGGRIAHGAGLVLEIERDDVDEAIGPHQRLDFRSAAGETVSLRTGHLAGGRVDAGAECLAPSAFATYTSSHSTAQVNTSFVGWLDGVVLQVAPERRHARVDFEVRSRPAFEPYDLMVDVEPDRPEWAMKLLCPRRSILRRVLFLDEHDRLEYRHPDLSTRYEVSSRVVTPRGER